MVAMSIPIKVPSLPYSALEARVGHWYRAVGEAIAFEEVLLELTVRDEVVSIKAPRSGILEKIFFQTGEGVSVSTVLALLKPNLPGLLWDEEQQALIQDIYRADGVNASMEYELRQLIRQGEGKLGKGFGSALALPQVQENQSPAMGMGAQMQAAAQQRFKAHPHLANSSQFSGDFKDPRVTVVPANAGAQRAPQNAPTLGAQPQAGLSAPTPKPTG